MKKSEIKKVVLSYKSLQQRYAVGEECIFYLQSSVKEVKSEKKVKNQKGRSLSIALDCSSSMQNSAGAGENKSIFDQIKDVNVLSGSTRLDECKRAINEIVDGLNEKDYLSLVLFSSSAHVAFEHQSMSDENKKKLKDILGGVIASGSTALFEGWIEAAQQASQGLSMDLSTRIILLTDGEATTESNIDKISDAVKNMKTLGVSTSCFGVGVTFNEDLLISMSRSGDGNFRYIPDALMSKKAATDELSNFFKMIGSNVTLELSGNVEAQIVGMNKNKDGRYEISNLSSGSSSGFIVKTEKAKKNEDIELNVTLFWKNSKGETETESLLIVQKIEEELKEKSVEDVEVQGYYLSALANEKRQAISKAVSVGNWSAASEQLICAQNLVESMSLKGGLYDIEKNDLQKLQNHISKRESNLLKKETLWQTYTKTMNQDVGKDSNC